MENKLENIRIDVLDGFRAIAILMVILFHYFSRWIALYPYGDKYDFFDYGKTGVQFFFIISGFVILYTIENTKDFSEFWKKRIIRLFPAMLVASLITYSFCSLFDTEFIFPASHVFTNVLVSITFLSPNLLSSLLGEMVPLDYVSGSYWSLWPEIQFYLLVSIIYFFKKNQFNLFFFSLTFILFFSNFILHHIYCKNYFTKQVSDFFVNFDFLESLPYFCFGVLFYTVFKNKRLNKKNSIFFKIYFIGLLVFQIDAYRSEPLGIVLVFIFLMLFVVLIYYPKTIRFLENTNLSNIGVSSYFLYLIHENIGVLIIHKYGGFLRSYQFLFTLALMIFLIIASIFYTYTIEMKINKYLKKVFLKKDKK
jgi:peptidoglycan/LPS O-acetylase OafA/YrhL